MGNFQSVVWATDNDDNVRYSLAIIMGFYVVGLVLLLMVMQILALGFPNRWYLKLFWFEDRLSFYFTRKTIFGDRPAAIYYEVFAIAMSLISCGLFIYLTVEVSMDNTGIFREAWVIYIELGMSIFAVFDYILHFFLAETKIKHIMDPLALCDLIAAFPGLIAPGIGRFLYAFQFLRFLRVLRALLLLESYGFAPHVWRFRASAFFMRLFTLALAFVCFVFVMAGFMWISENSHQNSDGMLDTFLDACYLIIVTISTVGYGDFSPKSFIGKVAIMIIIVVAIALVPFVINILITAWHDYNADRRYSPTRSRKFVLMVGGTSKLINFAKEFYNEKRDKYPRSHVVVLSNSDVPPAVDAVVRKPFFRHRLRLYTGDPTSQYHLSRMSLKKTEACFIVPPERHDTVDAEDTEVVMTALAVKSSSPQTKVFALVFDSANRTLLREAGVEVCLGLDEVKLTMLAQNCLCPGLSTLFSNLMHNYNWSDGFTRQWERKYAFGSNHQVYMTPIPECLVGRAFSEATLVIYHFTNGEVLLMGVKGGSVWSHRKRLILNPQPHYKLLSGDTAFVICGGQSHANHVLQLTPESVRECMDGVGDVIRNIQAERDGDGGDGDVSTPADSGGGGFSPASRKSSRAKSEAAAPLSRHGDQDVNLVESTDLLESMERGSLDPSNPSDSPAPRPRRKIPIKRSPESRSLMHVIGRADKTVLMNLIREEQQAAAAAAAAGDLHKSATASNLYVSSRVTPRPRSEDEDERESENGDEGEGEGGGGTAGRKRVRIARIDSEDEPRDDDVENLEDSDASQRNQDAEGYADGAADDNHINDSSMMGHAGDVTRMPLAQKRSKTGGLLNALGKRVGTRGVRLDDDNVLALLPVPSEKTDTFQPVSSSTRSVTRGKKINLLEQSQAQFSHVVSHEDQDDILGSSSNHRTPNEMADLTLEDVEVMDVRDFGWTDHIVVCGCLRGLAQFIAPLREPHIKSPKAIVVMVPLGQLDDRAHPPSRLFAPFRQYKQVYALSYEAPITRDDFRRAGAETASNVIILDQWSGKESEQKKDAEGIIMYRLLTGLKLAGNTLISLETSSSIHYISPPSDGGETRQKWFRSELYASGGVVVAENQDTIMCQAYHMPEVVDFIKIVSRGVVLQLNVTTLTPLAKGMLYRDFLCLVVSTTDLIPLGLYRTDRETVPSKSVWGVSTLADLMRNTTEDVGQFRNRKKKGKAGLKKTQGFEEDSEDERKGSGGSGRGSMAKDDTAIRRDGSSESGMGNSNGGGSSGGVSLLDSDEKGSSRSHRRRRKQTSAEDEEDREIKYVLTHPPWDCRLQETDRVFLLLSDSETWARMRRRDQAQDPHEVIHSATPAERRIIEEQILQRLKGEKRKKQKVKQELREIAKKEREDEERHNRRRFVPWRNGSARPWRKMMKKTKAMMEQEDQIAMEPVVPDGDAYGNTRTDLRHEEDVEMTRLRETAESVQNSYREDQSSSDSEEDSSQ